MKFEACPVEPPGLGIGPLSIWTMPRQPRRARWQATELPTMPAPMTTTPAFSGRRLIFSDISHRPVRRLAGHEHRRDDLAQRFLRALGRDRLEQEAGAQLGDVLDVPHRR